MSEPPLSNTVKIVDKSTGVCAYTEIAQRAIKNHYFSNEKFLMCKEILVFIFSQFYVLYLMFEQK